MNPDVGFVGAGKMVSAIVHAILNSNLYTSSDIICCSAQDGTSERLSSETSILRSESIEEMLEFKPGILILGCKPQQFDLLPESISSDTSGSLIISIMAGITIDRLNECFQEARNIVRSMPNTPGQIGAGITGYLFANDPDEYDHQLTESLLSSLGEVVELPLESDIDALTAVSGSGPAYLFEFACALEEAARATGLSDELCKKLARQTIIGSAKLLEHNNETSPEELRKQVTSPNGTTQAALESFSENNLREIVRKAVIAAQIRSKELSSG